MSIIYLIFEGNLSRNKNFFKFSLSNLIFYSLSLSLPSILMIYYGLTLEN